METIKKMSTHQPLKTQVKTSSLLLNAYLIIEIQPALIYIVHGQKYLTKRSTTQVNH